MFQILKFIHINPLYLFLLFIYGSTRLIEYFADTSGTWQKIWGHLSSVLDHNVPFAYIFALPIYVIAFHWTVVGLLLCWNASSRRVKLAKRSRTPSESIDFRTWLDSAKNVLINQLIVLPSSMFVSYYFLKATKDAELVDFNVVPSFSMLVYKFVLCMMIYEISYFYIHFMLHHPLIYPHTQKQHTTFNNILQHPLEYALLNILPLALAVFLTRSDSVTSAFFMAIVIAPVFEQHRSASMSDSSGAMDYLGGTCRNFLQAENFKSHKILLSMRSFKQNVE